MATKAATRNSNTQITRNQQSLIYTWFDEYIHNDREDPGKRDDG